MLLAQGKIAKIVIIRPGALGDVLAARSVVAFFKQHFPDAEIALAAPGDRGAFLVRDGWADRGYNWDNTAFSWLFSDGSTPPPPALSAAFGGSSLIFAYGDFISAESSFEARLDDLAPAAGKVFSSAKPDHHHAMPIGEWLLHAPTALVRQYHLLPSSVHIDDAALASRRIRLDRRKLPSASPAVAIHPGSGSAKKNWSLDNYAVLCRRILFDPESDFLGARLIVTSGEADGDLGFQLCRAVPQAIHLHCPSLEDLAVTLATADLYIGNDSGVSHLAAAVQSADCQSPKCVVLFGPSEPHIWAPPRAYTLADPHDVKNISVESVWRLVQCISRSKPQEKP